MNAEQKKELKRAFKMLKEARDIVSGLSDELKEEYSDLENQDTKKAQKLEADGDLLEEAADSITEIEENLNEEFNLER